MGKSQENIRDIIMQAVEAGRISADIEGIEQVLLAQFLFRCVPLSVLFLSSFLS